MRLLKLALLFGLIAGPTLAQPLDPDWKRCVALIESKTDTSVVPIGTGIFVIFKGTTYLVTNNHIAVKPNLYVRFNQKSATYPSIRLSVDSMIAFSKAPWYHSQKYDVAAIPLFDYRKSSSKKAEFDITSIGLSCFKEWAYLNEGDELFILGFPSGIGTRAHYTPVYRFGIVALKDTQDVFLVDANLYPGNSGGPVFIKPAVYDYHTNTLSTEMRSYLVGIVSSYLPYIDVAVSIQTQRPRITFEENSGLAVAYSTETIVELLVKYDNILNKK